MMRCPACSHLLADIDLKQWHDRINDISDLCNTPIIYDRMSKDEIIDLFNTTLHRIDELATYPDAPSPPPVP